MTFKITKGSGNKKAFNAIAKMPKGVKTGMRRGAFISGKELVADVVKNMTHGTKTGRIYKISSGRGGRLLKKPRLHQASAAGEYPAVISGDLRSTVGFKVRGYTRMDFGAGSSSIKYAKFLENGTSKMKPRKYLKQTINKLGNRIKTNIVREINKIVK